MVIAARLQIYIGFVFHCHGFEMEREWNFELSDGREDEILSSVLKNWRRHKVMLMYDQLFV
jgi:hypothetical protein